ncbi:hypothetical protein J7337_006492 [Fusarium musae]|uniref:Uncharacterized protein n=1 Tax=Fusarium musae TaxID=1042133 RepID=A0A9P8IMZ2_9HYPO|nr:hypothetical protein J7337_006492 [Fusarium musae]KAG9500811.1 hypothetical protein J7337_006492 [Fusarium musae]
MDAKLTIADKMGRGLTNGIYFAALFSTFTTNNSPPSKPEAGAVSTNVPLQRSATAKNAPP